MEQYRQEIIDTVLSAQADKVDVVLVQSLVRLKQNKINGHLIQRYCNRMLDALSEIRGNEMPPGTSENVNTAIEFFKKILGKSGDK